MKITLENNFISATFESKGAELISLIKKTTNLNFIWNGNPSFWAKHSPILFPIVGTLKNDTYYYNEQPYSLSRHGFARDMTFDIISQNENSITFSLTSNKETLVKLKYRF